MSQAKNGQVWQDEDARVVSASTFTITDTDGVPGGFAHGIRHPSGRKTRVRLDDHGGVRGYVLLKDA